MNDFDDWNKIKKLIEAGTRRSQYYPQQGEVWMCLVGKNIGNEQNGSGERFSRPVLIIKKFNNQMFWTIPLSTKQKDYDFYYNFTDPNQSSVSAVVAQIKLMSGKRLVRLMYKLNKYHFNNIKTKIRLFV